MKEKMAWRTSSVRESIPFLTGSYIKEYLHERNIGQWGYLAKGAERGSSEGTGFT